MCVMSEQSLRKDVKWSSEEPVQYLDGWQRRSAIIRVWLTLAELLHFLHTPPDGWIEEKWH